MCSVRSAAEYLLARARHEVVCAPAVGSAWPGVVLAAGVDLLHKIVATQLLGSATTLGTEVEDGESLYRRALEVGDLDGLRRVLDTEAAGDPVFHDRVSELVHWLHHVEISADEERDDVDLRPVLADTSRLLGHEHPATLTLANRLAGVLQDEGNLAAAIQLYEQILVARHRSLGNGHRDTLISASNLAGAYRDAGKLTWALRLLEATVLDCVRLLGADDPQTLLCAINLTEAYQTADDPDRAARFYEQFLIEADRTVGANKPGHDGPQHPDRSGPSDAPAAAPGRPQDSMNSRSVSTLPRQRS
jgi:tetratricopeptide (TPR) repeat protein